MSSSFFNRVTCGHCSNSSLLISFPPGVNVRETCGQWSLLIPEISPKRFSSTSKKVSLRFAQGFSCAKTLVDLRLPPMLWARSHHFEMVSLFRNKILMESSGVWCIFSIDHSSFSHLRPFDETFDCPVGHCLFRQKVVNFPKS